MKKKIISKFNEKPKTGSAWKTLYLGLSSVLIPLLLGLLSGVLRQIFDPVSVNAGNKWMSMGFGSVMIALLLSVLTIIKGIDAFKKGDRSWIAWTGFILAALAFAFWSVMIIGEIIFPH